MGTKDVINYGDACMPKSFARNDVTDNFYCISPIWPFMFLIKIFG